MSSQTIRELYESHEGKTTDKWSLYLDEYDKIFAAYRCCPVCLLEIGVQNGGSLDIWGHYFSQAEKIIGCDIDARCAQLQYDDPRIVVIVGDANSDECEQKILAQAPGFEIIIDDGSHRSSDIGRSFARYFRHLKDGGVYIVEDLHASYWEEFEGGLHHPGSIMGFLKRLADVIHHEHWQNRRTRRRRDLLASHELQFGIEFDEFELARIHSVEFINSLCMIRKLSPDQNVLGHRVVAGTDEYVNRGCKILDRTTIRDSAAGLKDDSDLEIFDLVQAKAERDHLVGESAQLQATIQEHQQTLVKRDEQIAAHVRERDHLVGEAAQLQAMIQEHQHTLVKRDEQIAAHVRERERLVEEIDRLSDTVRAQQAGLEEKDRLLTNIQEKKDRLERDSDDLRRQVDQAAGVLRKERSERSDLMTELGRRRVVIESEQRELELIQTSLAWRTVSRYRRLKDRLLPVYTRRRKLYDEILIALKGTATSPTDASSETTSEPLEAAPELGKDTSQNSLSSRENPAIKELALVTEEPVPKGDATVSVVIPTKDAGEDFRRVLAMLKNQKGFRDIEVIVVDSGSTDKTLEYAERLECKVIKILPEEFSHSYARNLGAGHASGEYLVFTVQDAIPPSDSWLHELFSVIKKNDIVAVSCAEFPWETADLFYRVISWNHYKFLEVDNDDKIMRHRGTEDHLALRKNAQLSDLACLISRSIFAKYEYKTDYGEDLDLGLRLIKDGYKIAFLGSVRIIHSHNRPAYYYLKRGYVENLFLPLVFPDYPTPKRNIDLIFRDMVFTYQVVSFLINEGTWGVGVFPCKTDRFSSRVIDRFQVAADITYPISTQPLTGYIDDDEFQNFMKRITEGHGLERGNGCPGNGDLSEAVLNSIRTILAYMNDTYEIVDDYIAEEFKSSLYKMFAYQCGAYLAQCFLGQNRAGKEKLEQIHRELRQGV